MFWNRNDDMVEIRERRWEAIDDDEFVYRAYRCSTGSLIVDYRKIRWYNRWFIKLKNRNRPKDKRTMQQFMRDAGIVSVSSPQLGVHIINTELAKKKLEDK
ncbi:MAG: hypothetical protein K6G24_14620 [Lachnospiraceae bacterium]|nr:hypothetical protein [Lachnospiraceae bacterium]